MKLVKTLAKARNGSPKNPDLRAKIESRAYDLWLADGCRDGNALDHWLKAEQELMADQHRQSID
jgi:hypothetical protein